MRFYLLLIFLNHLFPLIVSNGVAPKVASSKPFTAVKTFGSKVASSKPFTALKTFGSKVASSKPFTAFKTFGSKVASSKPFTALKTFGSTVANSKQFGSVKTFGSKVANSKPFTAVKTFGGATIGAIAGGVLGTARGAVKSVHHLGLATGNLLQGKFSNSIKHVGKAINAPFNEAAKRSASGWSLGKQGFPRADLSSRFQTFKAQSQSAASGFGSGLRDGFKGFAPTVKSKGFLPAVGQLIEAPIREAGFGFKSAKLLPVVPMERSGSMSSAGGSPLIRPSSGKPLGPRPMPSGFETNGGSSVRNPSLSGRSASSASGASAAPLERSPSVRSATFSSQDLNRLNKMFPNHDVALVRDALHSSGNNINGAASFLLKMPPAFGGAAPTQSTSSASGTVAQNPSLSGGSAASVSGASSASLERPLAASKGIDVKGKGPAVKDTPTFWSRPGPSNDQRRFELFDATARKSNLLNSE